MSDGNIGFHLQVRASSKKGLIYMSDREGGSPAKGRG